MIDARHDRPSRITFVQVHRKSLSKSSSTSSKNTSSPGIVEPPALSGARNQHFEANNMSTESERYTDVLSLVVAHTNMPRLRTMALDWPLIQRIQSRHVSLSP